MELQIRKNTERITSFPMLKMLILKDLIFKKSAKISKNRA